MLRVHKLESTALLLVHHMRSVHDLSNAPGIQQTAQTQSLEAQAVCRSMLVAAPGPP